MPSQLEPGGIVGEDHAADQTDHDDRLVPDHGLESPVQEGQQRCQVERGEVTDASDREVNSMHSVRLRIARSPRHQEADDGEIGNDEEHSHGRELHGDDSLASASSFDLFLTGDWWY